MEDVQLIWKTFALGESVAGAMRILRVGFYRAGGMSWSENVEVYDIATTKVTCKNLL